MERRLAAILAADVVGYSGLMELNEAGTLTRLRSLHKDLVKPRILQRKGRIVKLMGDGLLAEFSSVVEAVECAIDIQRSMDDFEPDQTSEGRISLRIGINLGDVIIEGADIYGDGVNIAARLEGLAEPRGICVSGKVYEEVGNKIGEEFEHLGKLSVKNITRPVDAWRWLSQGSPRIDAAPQSPADRQNSQRPSIAVLPFRNMSGDAEQEYFADGITEDITIDLTRLSSLRVSARDASFAYKNARMTLKQIALELQADFVLTGSVRKSGDSVRITAQLVDGHTEEHVWAERYDRKLENVFELQSDISSHIVDSLSGSVAGPIEPAITNQPTKNTEAYENYLRARILMREMTRRSVELAMSLLLKAVDSDSDYALAFCGLSDCAATLATHYVSGRRYSDDAAQYALRALEIDPNLAEAHGSYGKALQLLDDIEGAEREYRRAIELSPDSYQANLNMGLMYLVRGDAEIALPFMLKTYELTEGDLQAAMMLSNTYRALGNSMELHKIARKTIDLSERRLRLNPEDDRAAYVGAMAYLDIGEVDRARQLVDLAVEISLEDARASYNLACAYGLLGDLENSLAHLEKMLLLGCPEQKKEWMKVDSDLKAVREDPRFNELLAQFS